MYQDRGDGQGRIISYPDFINAFVKVKEQHPFLADRKKMMQDGRRRDSAKVRAAYGVGSLSGMDQDGRYRLPHTHTPTPSRSLHFDTPVPVVSRRITRNDGPCWSRRRRLVTPGSIAPVGCPTGGLSPSHRSRPEPLAVASPSLSRRTASDPSPRAQSHRYLPT